MYIGPETLMPIASAAAAAVGVALMFWHRLVGWVKAAFRWLGRRWASRRESVPD